MIYVQLRNDKSQRNSNYSNDDDNNNNNYTFQLMYQTIIVINCYLENALKSKSNVNCPDWRAKYSTRF